MRAYFDRFTTDVFEWKVSLKKQRDTLQQNLKSRSRKTIDMVEDLARLDGRLEVLNWVENRLVLAERLIENRQKEVER
jgi:hypothetical protein